MWLYVLNSYLSNFPSHCPLSSSHFWLMHSVHLVFNLKCERSTFIGHSQIISVWDRHRTCLCLDGTQNSNSLSSPTIYPFLVSCAKSSYCSVGLWCLAVRSTTSVRLPEGWLVWSRCPNSRGDGQENSIEFPLDSCPDFILLYMVCVQWWLSRYSMTCLLIPYLISPSLIAKP